VLFGTGCDFIIVLLKGKQLGSGGNSVATAGVEAVVAEAVESVMVGALGVGVFASGANVGNGVRGLVEVGQCAMAAG